MLSSQFLIGQNFRRIIEQIWFKLAPYLCYLKTVAYAGGLGGFKVGGPASYGVPGAEAPPADARKFSKIYKKFPKKIAKTAVFSPILQRIYKNHAFNFRAFGRQTQLVGEILRKFWNFSKICKIFLKKNAKTAVFSPILQRNYKTTR